MTRGRKAYETPAVKVTISLPPPVHTKLMDMATHNGLSRSAMVAYLITDMYRKSGLEGGEGDTVGPE